MPEGPWAALAIVAVACSAVTIPLNPRLTVREIEVCLATLQPDAVLLMKDSHSATRQAAECHGLTIVEAIPLKDGVLGFSIVAPQINAAAKHSEADEPDPNAPAFILQTSGTASEPKLIPFSHRNMLAAAARLRTWFDLTPQDRCLSASPPFYSHGLKVTIFAPLLTGGTACFPTDASKFDYAEWFTLLKPTWYSAGNPPTDLMTTSTRERALRGGRDHRNPRPASIGTGGRLRSESTADFVGIRTYAPPLNL